MNKILATVTDEEAERLKKGRAKLDVAIDLLEKAKKLAIEADRLKEEAAEERRVWFHEMREKYELADDLIIFDPETKTIRQIEEDEKRAIIRKVLETMAGLSNE